MITKTCPFCQKEFATQNKRQIYCSFACKTYQHRKKYYVANKVKISDKGKAYYAANKKTVSQRTKVYAQTHIEEYRVYRRQYQEKNRYKSALHNAKSRNLAFLLSEEEYGVIVGDGKCHYCERLLSPTGSGLDRKNNEPFYNTETVVACCADCNRTFGAMYSYQEKLVLAKAIKEIIHLRAITK